MKGQFLAYLAIALTAELGTTFFQRFRTTTDVDPGLYYPDFKSLLISRLIVWLLIFVLLSGTWLAISSRRRGR